MSKAMVMIGMLMVSGLLGWAGDSLPLMVPDLPELDPATGPGKRPSLGALFGVAFLGNLAGTVGGVVLGSGLTSGTDDFDDNGVPYVLGGMAGSAFGSATGAAIAANARGWHGSYAAALLGGVLGVGISIGATLFFADPMWSIPLMAVLPPACSAIFISGSLKPRHRAPAGALLSLSGGRLGLGVPAVKVRPLFVPGCGSKPEMQFSVRLLSVQL